MNSEGVMRFGDASEYTKELSSCFRIIWFKNYNYKYDIFSTSVINGISGPRSCS